MKKYNFLKTSMTIAIMFIVGACNKNADKNIMQTDDHPKTVTEAMMSENGANPDEQSITTESAVASGSNIESATSFGNGHYVYTESNEAANNRILVYKISWNGSLHYEGSTASGGAGTGAGLGSQGALVLDKNHNWLFAVNAGSNSVSSFKVNNDGSLTLAHTESSGGTGPNSVSVYGNMLYVLNHGSDNIHGFWIGSGGTLTNIQGSTQSLSATSVDAPQISFTPNGDWIVVTEKATNIISTFRVKNNGSVNPGIFTPSVGQTPFGFDFSRNRFMIVSNAVGGAAGAGSATSYITGSNGVPKDINGAVPDLQAAPCWFATTKFGRFAYTTNTATNNISSYYVAPWGGLYLVQSEAAKTDMGPLDIVVATNNYYVYELNSKSNTIGGYHRKFFGGLEFINSASGLPAAATGLATY
ncbi:MAG: lactonase family protein [Ginsengibacter sp.]